ncbi:MAG: hypothetical protein EAX96_05430 [Candidatus Lokiarchaeota archaeon]|nr:hypothetical protein [Candidatus Lokiarchaeota archaeon]
MIDFKKITIPIKLKLPSKLKKTAKDNYTTEIRFHPLLKWFWSAVSTNRSSYTPFEVSEDKLKDLFTPRVHYFKNYEEETPEFPEFGRLKKNEALIFPNLFSWADIAICRITEAESVYLKDITIQQLTDALELSEQYFKKKAEIKDQIFYPTINMNFLRPSASSVLHPHLQLICTPVPNPLLYHLIMEGNNYLKENKTNFFQDLIKEEEKLGKRWIGKQGSCNFMTSYCPIAGQDEVFFVSDIDSSFPIGKLERIVDIATGISKIFKAYDQMGIYSINMTILSLRFNEKSDYFRISGYIWSRPIRNLDVSDRGFAELAHKIALSYEAPEVVAKKIRDTWK